jgi:hypothetical protein
MYFAELEDLYQHVYPSIVNNIRTDVDRELYNMFPNYHSCFPDSFYDTIVEDVIQTSAFNDDGTWNDSDVRLSIERTVARLCGVEET